MIKLLTLCIVHKENQVLLGMKKRGFGEGRFNGFGGKVHDGESVEDAAKREMLEEALITATDLTKLGILDFTFEDTDDIPRVHVFKCTAYEGQAGESEEMCPQWFSIGSIPFERMWKDDPIWFPLFLSDTHFEGEFAFDLQHNVKAQSLREVKTFTKE